MGLLERRWRFSMSVPWLGLALVLTLNGQGYNPRIDNFLNSLSTFTNIDLARSAVQNLRLTEAENRLLEVGLRKPAYKAQINRLLGTVKVPPAPAAAPVKTTEALKLEQTSKILGTSQILRAEAQSLLALSARSSVNLQAIMGTVPTITSLSLATIEPGQSLMIRGKDFLPQGSVTFVFGASSYTGAVDYWGNDFILVRLSGDIQGIPMTDGTVIVRKPNPRLQASAAVRFVPIWAYFDIRSEKMTYASNPYDPVVAFYNYVVRGIIDWCSSFSITYSGFSTNRLINGYTVQGIRYETVPHTFINQQYDNQGSYIGSSYLPGTTAGQICHSTLMLPPAIYCVARIKGPLGLPYK